MPTQTADNTISFVHKFLRTTCHSAVGGVCENAPQFIGASAVATLDRGSRTQDERT